ncbi:hypothetical protein RRG08_035157 [Elysia crispata]|uniref:PiggyBac transposable element-derived protein domain-containing protein n=1 Tax=Elysia crispata TaxID=231223 RepID=A0AAE1B5U2_9GAST|nr:hypothetical protein RRG08_035157 [Elysia crispata]
MNTPTQESPGSSTRPRRQLLTSRQAQDLLSTLLDEEISDNSVVEEPSTISRGDAPSPNPTIDANGWTRAADGKEVGGSRFRNLNSGSQLDLGEAATPYEFFKSLVTMKFWMIWHTAYIETQDRNSEHAIKVFNTLLEPFHPHHHIFADRYYTTFALIEFLRKNGYNYTGTVQVNRRGFAMEWKQQRLTHMQAVWHYKEDVALSVTWKDKKAKKPCHVVTTCGKVDYVTVQEGLRQVTKPAIIQSYNNNMNGCDRIDQQLILVGAPNVMPALLAAAPTPPAKPGRKSVNPAEERLSGNRHLVDHDGLDRQCVYCSLMNKKKRSTYYCSGCEGRPHLCPKECFRKYHTDRVLQTLWHAEKWIASNLPLQGLDSYLATLITITETSCCRPRLEEPKKRSCYLGLPPVDGRGKHASRPHKMSNELRQRIRDHISSFRGRKSHYSQEKTRRLYLPEELNISKMLDLYKER